MKNDLTQGSVLKNVIRFSLPYLLSYFLQTLYGMADLFIIGQFEGVSSTTAVAVGSQVMHMLTIMLVGLAMGATVSIGQSVGAGDRRQAALYTGNTVTLFMALSLVLTAMLLLLRQSITASLYCADSRLSCAPRKKTQVRIPQHTAKMPTNSTMGPAMARRPVVHSLCLISNSSPAPGKARLSVRPDFQQRSPGRQGKGGQFAQSLTVR